MIGELILQSPFMIPSRFIFNEVTPEVCAGDTGYYFPAPCASHQGAILEAYSSEKHTRKEVLDYSAGKPKVVCQELTHMAHAALTKCGFLVF